MRWIWIDKFEEFKSKESAVAVKNVTLSMAPQASQDVIKKFGRPEYDSWISKYPVEMSLPATSQVAAFDTWDRQVGSAKKGS